MTWYKATRPDGTDFRTGRVGYAGALASGAVVEFPHPYRKFVRDDPSTYLSVSSEPGEVLTGGSWPCRLFTVEPVGAVESHSSMGWKGCVRTLRVTGEVDAHLALGPNGATVAAVIGRAGRLSAAEAEALAAAWGAAWGAAWDAAWGAAWGAAWDAGVAEVVRDLITPAQYQVLAGPWLTVIGQVTL